MGKRDQELFNRLMASEIPPYKELLAEANLYEADLAPTIAMKLLDELLKAAARKRGERAGEEARPTKKSWWRALGELSRAFTAPAKASPAKELGEGTSVEARPRGDAPVVTEASSEGGGQPAQSEEAAEGPTVPIESVKVVELEAEDEAPARAEMTEALVEPEAGGDIPEARGEEDPAGGEGEEPMTTPGSSAHPESSVAGERWPP